MLRYKDLSRHPKVFQSMTGLRVAEFDELVAAVRPAFGREQEARLSRRPRQRALGGGRHFELAPKDQILLTVVWLRQYLIHEVLAYLFDVSDSTVSRVIARVLPLLEQAGRDSMRLPDPGKKHRRTLEGLLAELPEVVVIIDRFEQPVQRPRDRQAADDLYSGKKKRHTLKSQITVREDGKIADSSESTRGPTADITLLKQSGVLDRLAPGVGSMGDLAYVGSDQLHPEGLGAAPRKKPRGQPRSAEDIAYNTAFSRRRIVVEHTIGRLRRFQSLAQVDRNHRRGHAARVRAVAGLVNRQLDRLQRRQAA
jgi:DDE superfamily endonuclease/Helix-turn-helix of DDE superfamily endonuclease